MQKTHLHVSLKVCSPCEKFRALRNRPSNPAGGKSVRIYKLLKLDTMRKEDSDKTQQHQSLENPVVMNTEYRIFIVYE